MIITVDARMIGKSGIGTYLSNILPFLVEEFRIILLGSPEEIQKYAWSDETEIVSFNQDIYSISEQWFLPSAVPESDIFWSPHYNIPLLPVKARKRIVTIHDVYHLAYYNSLSLPQKIYAKIMISSAAKKSDLILTVSEFSKQEILKYTGINSEKVSVIYNGVNSNFFERTSDKPDFFLPDRFILFVGNVKPHKNLKNALLAYASVKQQKHNLNFVIVGEKENLRTIDNELWSLIKQLNIEESIFFTGHVDAEQLPYIYKQAQLLIFPSYYEGFGLPPLEAMSAGLPAVVSRAASLPDVCGKAAYYIDPFNVPSMASGILKVLDDLSLRKEMIDEGFRQIRKFQWQTAAEKIKNIFKGL